MTSPKRPKRQDCGWRRSSDGSVCNKQYPHRGLHSFEDPRHNLAYLAPKKPKLRKPAPLILLGYNQMTPAAEIETHGHVHIVVIRAWRLPNQQDMRRLAAWLLRAAAWLKQEEGR